MKLHQNLDKRTNTDVHIHLVQYSNLIYRPLAQKIVNLIENTNITPNQITVVSFVFGILSAIFFAFGYQLYLIIALILLHLSILADFVDGGLARKKNMSSVYGAWLDSNIDRMIDPVLFLGIAYGVYNLTGDKSVWVICCIAVMTRLLVDIIYLITRTEIPSGLTFIADKVNRGWLVRLFLYGRTNIHLVTTVAVIFNRMYLYLIVISLYSFSFYIYSLFYLNRKIKKTYNKSQ
jgi:phosphatidylglycerophosphate synthase